MANFPVFKLHHKKAGHAADQGDHQTAMHHVGKMLSALKASAGMAPMIEGDEKETPITPQGQSGTANTPLRSKLAGIIAAKQALAQRNGGM